MVPAYMLSLLRHQWTVTGDAFISKHIRPWLVWEPGTWTAPAATSQTMELDPKKMTGLAAHGDALSFELIMPKGATVIHVGRNNTNDIVVNDATVSRQHVLLARPSDAVWTVEAAPNIKAPTKLGDRELKPGQAMPLSNGAKIQLGDVTMTFYEPAGFLERLKAFTLGR